MPPAHSTYEVLAETVDVPPGAADEPPAPPRPADAPGVQLALEAPSSNGRSMLVHRRASASGLVDPAGSLAPASGGHAALRSVSLGALHAALRAECGEGGTVTEERFGAVVGALLRGADAPPAEAIAALFRAFDADGSGAVDEPELLAGCAALCAGEPAEALRLAFACFDKDGDGRLTGAEISALLRGTIEPAVRALYAAIDFADADAPDALHEIAAESGGAAALSEVGAQVRVELKTPVGTATILAPRAALAADALAAPGAALGLDAFLDALVGAALARFDADGSGTLEGDEFVAFAAQNPFLSMWFGRLAQSVDPAKASWKDDFSAS